MLRCIRRQLLLALLPVLAVFAASIPLLTDADLGRYFAYCRASLGRSYDDFYVRSGVAWQRAFESGDRAAVDEYARRSAIYRALPERPLVPYRDFFVEYPPGFFLAVMPPALLAPDLATYKWMHQLWMGALLTVAVSACAAAARS